MGHWPPSQQDPDTDTGVRGLLRRHGQQVRLWPRVTCQESRVTCDALSAASTTSTWGRTCRPAAATRWAGTGAATPAHHPLLSLSLSSCNPLVSRYGYNCPQVLAWWLEPWTGTLASISLGFCVLDIFVILATLKLRTYIRLTRDS